MNYYRQHPIVLLFAFLWSALFAGVGVIVALKLQQPLFFGFVLFAALFGIWQYIRWTTLSIFVQGRQVTVRTLNGFVINERVVSLNAPGGLRLRQNLSGILFDYGMLRIEVFGTPVQIRYIAPFSSLKRQIDQ